MQMVLKCTIEVLQFSYMFLVIKEIIFFVITINSIRYQISVPSKPKT